MTPVKTRPRKTVEDFMKLPEGVRAELIEGEIFMSPSPKEKHQRAAVNLTRILSTFVQKDSLGRLYAAPFDVHLPSGDIVEPDLIFVSTGNQSIIQDWIRGVPDLLVEIISPDSPERDRIVKRHLYQENGVKEYWLVDIDQDSIEVLKLSGKAYTPHGYFEAGDALTSAVIPGLSLPVRQVFA
jgi:Uma2 family endonuclease